MGWLTFATSCSHAHHEPPWGDRIGEPLLAWVRYYLLQACGGSLHASGGMAGRACRRRQVVCVRACRCSRGARAAAAHGAEG